MSTFSASGSGDRSGGSDLQPHLGPLSLAAGVPPEFEQQEVVSAAAGFEMVGIWFDPGTWSPGRAREVRRRLDGTGVEALDMEPVFVTPEGDRGFELVDAAAEVGARNVLTSAAASSQPGSPTASPNCAITPRRPASPSWWSPPSSIRSPRSPRRIRW